uniref:YAP binding domain-containing protein n=1 Tax=Acrobeloides nanus TaxID=290746 RepID=A0A914C6Q0_9BILA
MNECGVVSVLNNKVQSGSSDDFIQFSYILERLFGGLPVRTVSSDKLSMISFVDYIFDSVDNSKTILLLTTFATEKNLPEISLSSIQHLFDSTLTDLFQCLRKDIFYVAHIWANMDFNTDSMNFMSEQVYYSTQKLDLDIMGVDCFYGSTIASFNVGGFNVEEININSRNYYVYHLNVLWPQATISFIKNFAKLKKNGEYKSLKQSMNSYACLTVLTDQNTCEVLLVIAHIYEYSEDKAGYKFYKLVD